MLDRTKSFISYLKIKVATRTLIIPLSFLPPIFMLYLLDPASFELVWKGRAPLLIFLWLLSLELALGWKKLVSRKITWTWFRIAVVSVMAVAPTMYVTSAFFLGIDHSIWELGRLVGATSLWAWPISLEYVILATFFTALSFLLYRTDGLKRFSISAFFLWGIGFFYMVDTFYPLAKVTVLELLASPISKIATSMLLWMGYDVSYVSPNNVLVPAKEGGIVHFVIHWPCAGVNSLFIYTFVILLFLKQADISSTWKAISFVVGAVGTFLLNILRVVTIFKLVADVGKEAGNMFHSYYGELYFIAWIIAYPLAIIYVPRILKRRFVKGN